MGAYLAHPITEKHSSDERNDRLKCGASSMQGWRVSQEDAHNCILNFTENASLFAVYDGHGGKEVAEYTAQMLPDVIKETESFKKGDYAEALKQSFLSFDKSLTEPEVVAKLNAIKSQKGPGSVSTDDEDENIGDLREEAAMPLEQLMARYRKGRLAESKEAPASPFLRAKASSSDAEPSSSSSVTNSVNLPESSAVSSSSTAVVGSNSSSGSSKDKSSSSMGEPSVSSSLKRERSRTSLAEKYSNGEVSKADEQVDSSVDVLCNGEGGAVKEAEEEEISSSLGNGPVEGKGKGKGKALVKNVPSPPKKKDNESAEDLFKKFVSVGAVDDSSDSDDNFPEQASSSTSGEADAELPEDVESEQDEEEDDDDDEEDDDDEDEDDDKVDDEFSMGITDELAAALKEGRASLLGIGEDSNSDSEEDGTGIGKRFLIDALTKRLPGSDSGCTAVVALVLPQRVLVANAGDSRCVACRGGLAEDLSVDHKPEDEEELARIVKAGGKVTGDGRVNGGLNLSRALGDHEYKQKTELPLEEQMISPLPDICEIEVTDDVEFLVLACDGVWNFMSSQEVVDFVRQRLQKNPTNLSVICEELFDYCLAPNTIGDGTGCDNMTAIIVQFRPSPEQDETSNASTAKRPGELEVEAPSKRIKTDEPDFPTTAL